MASRSFIKIRRKNPSEQFASKAATIDGVHIPAGDGVGVAVILFLTLMLFFVIAISEPFGDDVLFQFDNGISYYLDEEPSVLGERISSLSQAFDNLWHMYLKWTGRVVGFFFVVCAPLIPPVVRAFLSAAICMLIVLLSLRLVYGSFRKAVSHPVSYFLLFCALYWYKPAAFYSRMWTMISVYSIPLLLCLLYYNLSLEDKNWAQNRKWLIGFNILGLFTGLSHEILGAILIVMLGVNWLGEVFVGKKQWNTLFHHTGLGIGYLLCFFSPGNFNRIRQSHDATVASASIQARIVESISSHRQILWPEWQGLQCLLLCAVAAVILSLIVSSHTSGISATVKRFFSQNIPYLVGGLVSLLAWGAISYAPTYGMDMWICLIYIILLKTADAEKLLAFIKEYASRDILLKSINIFAAVSLCILFAFNNFSWLKSYSSTALERHQLITEAVEEGLSEVIVPPYEDSAEHCLVPLGYLNRGYTASYHVAYWGIPILVEQPEGN